MKADVLFDLDGTLWNSAWQVVAAWNTVLPAYPRAGRLITEEDMAGYMGKTIQEIAPLALPHLPYTEALDIVLTCCGEEEKYLAAHGGTLYTGLEETLKTLCFQGRRLFIVSNCQTGYLSAFFAGHGLAPLFSGWECAGRTGKTKGENISSVCGRYAVANGVFVGDTKSDEDAAAMAGFPFIHAAYGFGAAGKAAGVLKDIGELPALLAARFDT